MHTPPINLPKKSNFSEPTIYKKHASKISTSVNIKVLLLPLSISIPPISDPKMAPKGTILVS